MQVQPKLTQADLALCDGCMLIDEAAGEKFCKACAAIVQHGNRLAAAQPIIQTAIPVYGSQMLTNAGISDFCPRAGILERSQALPFKYRSTFSYFDLPFATDCSGCDRIRFDGLGKPLLCRLGEHLSLATREEAIITSLRNLAVPPNKGKCALLKAMSRIATISGRSDSLAIQPPLI